MLHEPVSVAVFLLEYRVNWCPKKTAPVAGAEIGMFYFRASYRAVIGQFVFQSFNVNTEWTDENVD